MSEAIFQAKIIKRFTKQGWLVVKLIQTNLNGIPDLLLMKKGELPFFIECKAATGRLAPLQAYRIKEIEEKTGYITQVLYEGKEAEDKPPKTNCHYERPEEN